MVLRTLTCVSLITALFFVGLACAAEFDVTVLSECRESGTDPTIVTKIAIPPQKKCGEGTYGARYVLEDEWLGIRLWLNPQGGLRTKQVIKPKEAAAVADNSKFKVCGFTAADASYVTEWFTPVHLACTEGRGPVARQYFAGKVCLVPRDVCVELWQLHPLAQERVHNSIVAAVQKARATERKKR